MNPVAIFGLGVPELLIILAVVLLLFGGTRLAGLGKSSGKAIREFKQETRSIREDQAKSEPVKEAEEDNSPYSVGVRDYEPTSAEDTSDPNHKGPYSVGVRDFEDNPGSSDKTVHDAEVVDPDDRR